MRSIHSGDRPDLQVLLMLDSDKWELVFTEISRLDPRADKQSNDWKKLNRLCKDGFDARFNELIKEKVVDADEAKCLINELLQIPFIGIQVISNRVLVFGIDFYNNSFYRSFRICEYTIPLRVSDRQVVEDFLKTLEEHETRFTNLEQRDKEKTNLIAKIEQSDKEKTDLIAKLEYDVSLIKEQSLQDKDTALIKTVNDQDPKLLHDQNLESFTKSQPISNGSDLLKQSSTEQNTNLQNTNLQKIKASEIDIQPLIQELLLEYSEKDCIRIVNVEEGLVIDRSPAIKLVHLFEKTNASLRDQKSRTHTTEPVSTDSISKTEACEEAKKTLPETEVANETSESVATASVHDSNPDCPEGNNSSDTSDSDDSENNDDYMGAMYSDDDEGYYYNLNTGETYRKSD
ncbi:7743_t:CDS:2, partial [Dentiscutata erythropus]